MKSQDKLATIFSKIINGDIPSYKIAEDEFFYAFLDINPVAKGHTLVVPKTEVDRYFDLNDDILCRIMPFCKRVADAIEKSVECNRIGLSVVGLEVPHAHVHLIPINALGDMSFSNSKVKMSTSEFQELAKRISANFN